MFDTPLNWRAAQAVATRLLADWQSAGKPGGAITLVDSSHTQAEISARLADRICLYFRGYSVDLIANRSRVLTFKCDISVHL
ncbi:MULTISPECIES: hypothetical protein [unclassified Serratia (in: enterobacteria)]|uniref:hypothetical protein n=1 Tax=unclassified Serratia (in: enterobacteria) TaxID=2647522 RepID=UPI00307652ED